MPDSVTISEDDRAALVAQIQALARAKGQAADDILSPTLGVGELRDQLDAYSDSIAPADPTSFSRAMKVLDYIGEVAGKLTPVVGFVGAVVGVASAAKGAS